MLEASLHEPMKALRDDQRLLAQHAGAPPSALGPGTWVYGASMALGRRVLASNPRVNVFHRGFKACDSYASGEAAMAAITCPVLFVLGAQDQMTQPKAAQLLIGIAKDSGKSVKVVSLAGGPSPDDRNARRDAVRHPRFPEDMTPADHAPDDASASEIAAGFDLRALPPDFYANPYPVYALLRETEPVKRMPDGSYFLTRYADLVSVYRDAQAFSSDKKVEFTPKYGAGSPLLEHHTTSLVFNDPPLHTRVRKLIMGALTRRAIADMEPGLVALVDSLLDRIEAQGGGDLIEDFASAIPVEIIGNLLGVPHADRGPCAAGRWPSWARWSPSSHPSRKPWAIAA